MNDSLRLLRRRNLVIGLMAGTLAVHLIGLYSNGSPDPGPALLPHIDKVAHVLLFAAPVFCIRLLTRKWWPIALMLLHAPASELVQYHLIPHRSGDWLDAVADVIGVILGVVLGDAFRRFSEVRDGGEREVDR